MALLDGILNFKKKDWKNGETIKEEYLDRIEDGIEEAHDGLKEVSSQLEHIVQVSIIKFGVVGDGKTDNIEAFKKLSAYVNSLNSKVEVIFPKGHYLYSDGLVFERECKLTGMKGSILDYIGNDKAIKLGIDGITKEKGLLHYENYKDFVVDNLTFYGGTNMQYGIYFNTLVTQPKVINCNFIGFGNFNSWSIYCEGGNWDIDIRNNIFDLLVNKENVIGGNGIYINSYMNGVVADNGNSRLRMSSNLMRSGHNNVTAIFSNSNNCIISHNKIEGYGVDIRLGGWSLGTQISHNYFECMGKCCIEFGSDNSRLDYNKVINNIYIHDNYCNVHNIDTITETYFIAPTDETHIMQNYIIENNIISQLAENREMIKLNNLQCQTNNIARNNLGVKKIHSYGSNIDKWVMPINGSLQINNETDNPFIHYFKTGVTQENSFAIVVQNYENTNIFEFSMTSAGYISVKNRGVLAYTITPNGTILNNIDTRSPKFTITNQNTNGSVVNGTLFEDSLDGKLKYKNLAGEIQILSN